MYNVLLYRRSNPYPDPVSCRYRIQNASNAICDPYRDYATSTCTTCFYAPYPYPFRGLSLYDPSISNGDVSNVYLIPFRRRTVPCNAPYTDPRGPYLDHRL